MIPPRARWITLLTVSALSLVACGTDGVTQIESGMESPSGVTTSQLPEPVTTVGAPSRERLVAFQETVTNSPFNGGVDRPYPASVEGLASLELMQTVVTGTVLDAALSEPVPTELFEGQDEVLDGATLATIYIDVTILVDSAESRSGAAGTAAPGSQIVVRVKYEIGRPDQIGGAWAADRLREADPAGARIVAVVTSPTPDERVFPTGSYGVFVATTAADSVVAADATMQPVVDGQTTEGLRERAAGVLRSRPADG